MLVFPKNAEKNASIIEKGLVGCAARFPNPLPYLWSNSAIFRTLFMSWPKIWYPIYEPPLWSLGEGLFLLALSSLCSRR